MVSTNGLRLPDFIGIGPARTGTTWLHQALTGHAGMPRRYKEIRFFNRYYSKGLTWYAGHFADFPLDMKVGEITPGYFRSPKATSRIARDIPQCKIIATLREPVGRMYSMYRLLTSMGRINEPSFERAIERYPGLSIRHNLSADPLRRWLRIFARERILICLYDDLEKDPQSYLDRITVFLDTPEISLFHSPLATQRLLSRNHRPLRPRLAHAMALVERLVERKMGFRIRPTAGYLGVLQFCLKPGALFPPLDPDVAAALRAQFRADNEAVAEIIGRDLSSWNR